MNDLVSVITTLVDRIRVLETNQWGNGFVPYLYPPLFGDNALTHHGYHAVMPLGPGDMVYLELTMPRKAENLEVAELLYIPTETGNWYGSATTAGGYCAEDESTHEDCITFYGETVTDDEIECVDITSALDLYSVGDVVGVTVKCDALYTTTEILILGVRLR